MLPSLKYQCVYLGKDWYCAVHCFSSLNNIGDVAQRNWKHIRIYTKPSFSDVYAEYTDKYRDGARWQAVYRCIAYQ